MKSRNRIDVTTRKAWHKQHRESKQSFDYFQHYLALEGRRSVRRVKEDYGLDPSHKMDETATRWSWTSRARLFDEHNQTEIDLARVNAIVSMEKRQGEAGRAMQALAFIEMKKILEKAKAKKGASLSVGEVVKLYDVGSKLERLSLNEPGEIIRTQDESATVADDAAQRAINAMAKVLNVEAPNLAEIAESQQIH